MTMVSSPTSAPASPSARAVLILYASLEKGKQLINGAPSLPPAPDGDSQDRYLRPRRDALTCWEDTLEFRKYDAALSAELFDRVEALAVGVGNELIVASKPLSNTKEWDREIALITSGRSEERRVGK